MYVTMMFDSLVCVASPPPFVSLQPVERGLLIHRMESAPSVEEYMDEKGILGTSMTVSTFH